jgi:hypothetical protein
MYGISLMIPQIPQAAGLFPADRYSSASLVGLRTVAGGSGISDARERGYPYPHPG